MFKDGRLVVRDGRAIERVLGRALAIEPGFDAAADRRLAGWYDRLYGIPHTAFDVPADATGRALPFETVPCRG